MIDGTGSDCLYFGAPVFTNGTIMLGYNDPWDDIGNQTAGSGQACVIYDNVRVVTISAPTILTNPSNIVAAVGTTTNLSVVASTVTGVTNNQWLRDGTHLVGQTSATLNFAPLANANFGGNYLVAVSDGDLHDLERRRDRARAAANGWQTHL